MTDDDKIKSKLMTNWQPPAPSPEAVAKILNRASALQQASAPVPVRARVRPVMWLAAAASFAAVLVWSSMTKFASPPAQISSTQMAQNDALDEAALTFVFSDQSLEDL